MQSTNNNSQGEAQTEENNDFKLFSTEDGLIPFLKDIWGFFGKKGVKTQFYSINSDKSYRLDIEVCESLGCQIKLLVNKQELVEKWQTIQGVVKNRKLSPEDEGKDWLKGMEKKWILPKNLVVKQVSYDWKTLSQEIASTPEGRCDILKIEGENEVEHMMLSSLITAGYRPGILLIRYTEDPDANVPSMITAGNLHMAGYKLLAVEGRWFLYFYTDVCLYESVSMRNTKTQNPIAYYLAELFKPAEVTKPEEANKSEEKPAAE